MERYLLFDAHCSVCNQLAHTIESESNGKLHALGLHEAEAKTMLDQAYPNGWEHAPYLVTVSQNNVRAWKDVGLALQLTQLLGPRKALKIWQLAQDSRPTGLSTDSSANHSSRRWFLRGGVLTLAAMLTSQFIHPNSVAFACVPCETCGCRWVYAGEGCLSQCGADPFTGNQYTLYDCFDDRSGEYCYTQGTFYCSCCCGLA